MLEAVFPEGPVFFRGFLAFSPWTFHARGHFPGRSCAFPGDLPCQCPFSRKVLPFSGGPSTPVPVFPEGPCPSALSLRYFGTPGTKNARFAPGLHYFVHYFGTPGAVMPLIQERQRRSRSTYDVCARFRRPSVPRQHVSSCPSWSSPEHPFRTCAG